MKEENNDGKKSLLESTSLNRYPVGFYLDNAVPNLAIVQILESILCDIEAKSGGVDSGNSNRYVVRRVSNFPTRAAVRGVPNDVERAPDIREGGNIAELRESRGEAVMPI